MTTIRPPAPSRDEFPHWTTDTVRYGDLDRQNHVNNAVYSTYFETGRVLVLRDPNLALLLPGREYAVVRAVIDFRAEMHWPGTAEIGTAITRVGNSSLTFAQAVFLGDKCTASCETIVVLLDAQSRRPMPFPKELVARIRETAPRAPNRI